MARKRNEAMLDGHSDWAGYSNLYWDKPANEARRLERWRAWRRDEAKRRKKRDELRKVEEDSMDAAFEGRRDAAGGGGTGAVE